MGISVLHQALSGLPASALMTSPVKTAWERWPVSRLVEFFVENGITGAPVISSTGALVGVVSISDVLRATPRNDTGNAAVDGYRDTAPGYEMGRTELAELLRQAASVGTVGTVGMIMTPTVITVEADAPLLDALRLMHGRRIHRVFVVKSGRLVGVISNSSLLEGLVGQAEEGSGSLSVA